VIEITGGDGDSCLAAWMISGEDGVPVESDLSTTGGVDGWATWFWVSKFKGSMFGLEVADK